MTFEGDFQPKLFDDAPRCSPWAASPAEGGAAIPRGAFGSKSGGTCVRKGCEQDTWGHTSSVNLSDIQMQPNPSDEACLCNSLTVLNKDAWGSADPCPAWEDVIFIRLLGLTWPQKSRQKLSKRAFARDYSFSLRPASWQALDTNLASKAR